MYEQFRNELMGKLGYLDSNMLRKIMEEMDQVANRYKIERMQTDLIVYGSEMPEMAKNYIVARAIEGLSKRTLKGYHDVLQNFFRTIGKPVDRLTPNDLRVWFYNYETRHHVGKVTLDHYRVILNSFFCWACSEKWLTTNPMITIKPIKYTKKQKAAMSQLELEYFREACQTDQETAIVEMLYSTGCRVSELSVLKKCDVDWEKREVLLFGKGEKYRTAYINAKAFVALQRYLAGRQDNSEYLIVTSRAPHSQIGKSGIERIIKRIAKRAGDKIGVHVTPHVFRHTTATMALQNGMPVENVQKMLGHVNINTTMIYAQVHQNDVKNSHTKCVI